MTPAVKPPQSVVFSHLWGAYGGSGEKKKKSNERVGLQKERQRDRN